MDVPRKVVLFSPYDFAFSGGVNEHIKSLNFHLLRNGIDSRIVAPMSEDLGEQNDGFIPMGRAIPVPSGGSIARVSLSVWLRSRIRRMVEEGRFDVVHIHEPFAGAITLSALGGDFSNNPVKVATFHTFQGTQLYKFATTRMLEKYSSRLDGRVAVSEPARKFIGKRLPGKYEVIPNGIDLEQFSHKDPLPLFDDGKINILFVGRLEKRKGLRYLLDAYSNLKWHFPNTRLIVVGSGNIDVESSIILGERNPGDVTFVGEVPDSEKAKFYASADIFCTPATGQESFGIVLLEAMASALPIVASDIEGFSHVVTHEREALLFEPRNVKDLENQLTRLIQDACLRRRLGNNGCIAVQDYCWKNITSRLIDYYDSLIRLKYEKPLSVNVGR